MTHHETHPDALAGKTSAHADNAPTPSEHAKRVLQSFGWTLDTRNSWCGPDGHLRAIARECPQRNGIGVNPHVRGIRQPDGSWQFYYHDGLHCAEHDAGKWVPPAIPMRSPADAGEQPERARAEAKELVRVALGLLERDAVLRGDFGGMNDADTEAALWRLTDAAGLLASIVKDHNAIGGLCVATGRGFRVEHAPYASADEGATS